MDDYRSVIYENYATNIQNAEMTFNTQAANRWAKSYDYYFRDWLPKEKTANIVDLACGGGKLLNFFQVRGYKNLCGVDISPEQVTLASQVISNVTETNIFEYLKAHPSTFDLITGLDIVEHFQKDEALKFLALCHSALRPRGRLILQTPNAESPWGTHHRYNDLTHEICFNPNSLVKLLALTNFTELETREQGPVPFGYSLPSSVRYCIWGGIKGALKLWNLAETGSAGSGVFSRVFLATGRKS